MAFVLGLDGTARGEGPAGLLANMARGANGALGSLGDRVPRLGSRATQLGCDTQLGRDGGSGAATGRRDGVGGMKAQGERKQQTEARAGETCRSKGRGRAPPTPLHCARTRR